MLIPDLYHIDLGVTHESLALSVGTPVCLSIRMPVRYSVCAILAMFRNSP